MIPGFATPTGTQDFAAQHPQLAAHRWFQPAGEILVSNLGLGTYLGHADQTSNDNYRNSILAALAGGINMIDTARNYRGGRSEQAIGEAIAQFGRREQLVLATKAGFAGQSHSLEPNFLEAQLDLSLQTLKVQTVDIFYLHNPETQLNLVGHSATMRQLERAFLQCEQFLKAGMIRAYGVATWSAFREPGQLTVKDVRAAAGPGFQWIQLPLNAIMTEGLAAAEQAAALGLNVATSASILQGKVAAHLPVALQFARFATGVTTALVGMGRPDHVQQNLAAAIAEIE
jgi:aryl-alcohol dehydrogenase-like predicted oxidoreductase